MPTMINTEDRKSVMSAAGYSFDKARTPSQALVDAGLDWTVEKVALRGTTADGLALVDRTDAKGQPVMTFGHTVRSDTGRVLGSVNMDGYHVFDNRTLADLGDTLLDIGGAQVISAGSWKGGGRVWMQFSLGDQIDLGGLDPIQHTLFITSGHDAGASLTALLTTARIYCTNQMGFIMKSAPRAFKLSHRATLDGRIQSMRDALGIAHRYDDAFTVAAESLIKAKMSAKSFATFMDTLIPLPVGVEPDSRAAANRNEAVAMIQSVFKSADNLDNVRGTKWAALQAVTEFEDWARPVRATGLDDADTRRFVRNAIADNTVKQRAFDLLTA